MSNKNKHKNEKLDLENNDEFNFQLTNHEKQQIESQIKYDLIDHLYKSTATGVITGLLTSIVITVYLYTQTKGIEILIWCLGFNAVLSLILFLDYYYKKNKNSLPINIWENLYVASIIICSIFWGSLAYFLSEELVTQFILGSLMVLLSSAYATGTVGIFYLSCISMCFIMVPLAIWTFIQANAYYYFIGSILVFYLLYLLGMSKRSTEWMIQSLRLKIENSYFTHQANYDLLTNLPNLRPLSKYIDDLIVTQDSSTKFAVICFSVNKLEMFNNSLGYEAGDMILKSVADRLKAQIEILTEQDNKKFPKFLSLPRQNTFIMVFSYKNFEELDQDVKSLFLVLKKSFGLIKREAILTASIGVCVYPKNGNNSTDLISNSQASMFKAKHNGGNCIEYYTKEINEKTSRKLELENDLHYAIKNNELSVVYQPIIDIKTNRVYGAESLIRWLHPKHGKISPVDFIDLAEESGLIIPIGLFVLQQACLELKRIHDFDSSIKISVNVSVKQLYEKDFFANLDKILLETGVDPNYIDLELTETIILDEGLVPIIGRIIDKGLSVSIDDFGTGYSGMSYFRLFKAEKIKIDKSFVDDIETNKDSADVVSAIIAMSRALEIKVLAEGVETEAQKKFLEEKECDYIQGFYFSKPLSSSNFHDFVLKYNGKQNQVITA